MRSITLGGALRRLALAAVPVAVLGPMACVGGETVSQDTGSDAGSDGQFEATVEASKETAAPEAAAMDGPSDAAPEAASCSPGYMSCGSGPDAVCTTHVAGDPMNCGACGNVCGTTNTTNVSCGGGSADAGTPAGKCSFTCSSAAYAHCSSNDSTGCETNVGIDAMNCGACGHSCQGGQCVSGFCQPVLLAGDPKNPTGLKSLYGIVVLNGFVYGVDWEGAGAYSTAAAPGGLIYKVSTAGGSLSWVWGQGIGASADSIATDGKTLTYSIFHVGEAQGAGIWQINPDGTNNTKVVSGGATGGGPACNLATAYGYETSAVTTDSGYIYWTRDTYGGCFPSTPSCQCQGIYRANSDGSGVTQFFTTSWYTLPIADSGTLYMLDYFNNQVVAATTSTFSSNASPVPIPTTGKPASLQIDPQYVYWVDSAALKFYRAAKIGATSAQDITPMMGMPTGSLWSSFLVDKQNIYFVSPAPTYNVANTENIYVMPKDGSGPARKIPGAVISSAGDSIVSWTQDASAIYWTTYGFDISTTTNPPPYSAIYKLAK
jgi:hypothetical protein